VKHEIVASRHVNAISARQSLRTPQRESLEILARVVETVPLTKQYDLPALLSAVQTEFPSVGGSLILTRSKI